MDGSPRAWSTSARRSVAPCLFVATVALIVVIFAGRHDAPTVNRTFAVSYTYECCRASMVNTVYHPGEILRLRWIRVAQAPGQTGQTSHATLELRVSLSGPFDNVAILKAISVASNSQSGSAGIVALPLRVPNWVAVNPVSIIRIPRTATSGYFNLSFRASTGEFSVSGASVVRVQS